ncbi:MAG: nicotinate-nucleotide--dimethylbenzimidazole phosphoribosyltransferase [Actinomycetota bacterium]|jgi:nicotinate-nucleotide--dimethylbenzimidazole phosphoribosyltransferase
MTWIRTALETLPVGDTAAAEAVRTRAADILRPAGALARFDEVAAFVAEWQRTDQPAVTKPAALIFAADHGVTAAGVSKYPIDVTAAMLAAYRAGKSTVSAFAAVAGATVDAIDVGVGRPTGDIRFESAMSSERFDEACDAGRRAVESLDADLLVLGEMGIGNTTAAAAVAAALGGGEVAAWVGRGTGLDDEGMARKREAVRQAVDRIAGVLDPLEVLREVGGAELVAMAAAIVAARQRNLPVLIDGYVVTAAAMPLMAVRADALDHCIVGHCSSEPGHRRLLERIAKQPLLDLEMRLGEGSGAMAAVPLVAMACAGITQVPTFAEWFG